MTASRNRRVVLLAFLLAALSAAVAYALLVSRPTAATGQLEVAPASGEPVLVSTRAISAGETLTADDVEIAYVPAEAKGARALTRSAQAVGQVALIAVPKGEQILAGSVGDAVTSEPETFANDVPIGMRAVSIESAETIGVGGLVQPGDRVDVIAAMELKPVNPITSFMDAIGGTKSEGDPFDMAELILQDVEVLAIGQALDANAPAEPVKAEEDEAAAEASGPPARPQATSVTLLVDPAQALRLLLAVEAEATFRLLLRAPGDSTITELPPALITNGGIEMEPFELVGANLVDEDLVITEARFRDTSIPAGGTLEFEATVRNASSHLIPAGVGGAASGHVYAIGDTWRSVGDGSPAGVYSLGVTSEHAEPATYPWRWELSEDLVPGATAKITGGIQVSTKPGVQRWWFGTMLQPGTVLEDGVAPVEITVEPVSIVVVTANEVEVTESPWLTSSSLMTLTRGARVDVLEYEDGWFLIRTDNTDGWVSQEFVLNAALPEAAQFADVGATPVPKGSDD